MSFIRGDESTRTRYEWLAQLNTESRPDNNYRRTSIICTIGPKTNSVEKINQLRKAGLNIVRMNFSHGSHEYHKSVIDNAREAERVQQGRPIAIALDTKGPEIRTGLTKGEQDFPISQGDELIITTDEKYANECDNKIMYIDYKNITKVIQPGRVIFVDDGILSFQVMEVVDEQNIKVRCNNNGKISSKKGVNLPGTDVDLPPLSEKDKADLRFGVEQGVDMVLLPLFAVALTSPPSVRSSERTARKSKSSPRLRTSRVSTTLTRFSRRLMV